MNGNNWNSDSSVITDWDNLKHCPFAHKGWVNPSDIDIEKDYQTGDFLRVYCDHDGRWCDAEFGYENCVICTDHLNE